MAEVEQVEQAAAVVANGEACHSANFVLHHSSGVRVQFTRRVQKPIRQFAECVAAEISLAIAAGWLLAEPGCEPGENTEEITGFVVGTKAGGEPCAWVFGPEHLKWRLDTVWFEEFETVPFSKEIPGGKIWPINTAPERNVAIEQGFFRPFKCQAVMRETARTTDAGKPIKEIARWVGTPGAAEATPGATPAATPGATPAALPFPEPSAVVVDDVPF